MPSLSEMRTNPPKSRLERSFDVVLDAELVRKVADLTRAAAELAGSPKPADRAAYAAALDELEALAPQLEDASGTLVLRANLSSGQWRNFVDQHPARPEGETGHDRDQRRTFGLVDSDALIDHLDLFAHTWDGEELKPTVRDKDDEVLEAGDFDALLRDNIAPGDLLEMATAVTLMYETSPDFGEWRTALSSGLAKLRGSAEPASSGSPRSDSTDGNPSPSPEGSTETDTPAP